MVNILGLSFYYHDSSAALVQDGRLVAAAEEERFIEHVAAVLGVLAVAVSCSEPAPADDPATVARWQGQLRYCRQQKQNDKTRRVLEKAFNPAWADRYIEELLFDDPPVPGLPD